MCGNFGLLLLRPAEHTVDDSNEEDNDDDVFNCEDKPPASTWSLLIPALSAKSNNQGEELDASIHEVSRLNGLRCMETVTTTDVLLSPLKILEAQTACTEIRGGQAGGYSSIEYKYETARAHTLTTASTTSTAAAATTATDKVVVEIPVCHRVRMVARKRYPLAADLAQKYRNHRKSSAIARKGPFSVISHTRFATSSENFEEELHPHEWVPFHREHVWLFNSSTGRFAQSNRTVGVHITHNGDFDELDAYSQLLVNEELGMWLQRVLHAASTAQLGDSPKIAGMMDLLRVQGRWSAAARLAWVRCVCKSPADAADGDQLHHSAPNSFPPPMFWEKWRLLLDGIWQQHVNNVIKIIRPDTSAAVAAAKYRIDAGGMQQLIDVLVVQLQQLQKQHKEFVAAVAASTGSTERNRFNIHLPIHSSNRNSLRGNSSNNNSNNSSDRSCHISAEELGICDISSSTLRGFIHHCVRGFLYSDLYTALTEFMSRAHGSFGIQAHCTLEAGVVVIASKGQPMCLSYDNHHPIVLFGSEAESLAVPVFQSGKWLQHRLDLDSKGEVVRIGTPRCLVEGSFNSSSSSSGNKSNRSSIRSKRSRCEESNTAAVADLAAAAAAALADAEEATAAATAVATTTAVVGLKPFARAPLQRAPSSSSSVNPKLLKRLVSATGNFLQNPRDALLEGALLLQCGVELRSYALISSSESNPLQLLKRTVQIAVAAPAYDPGVDLVAKDLQITPAVLAAIDKAWQNPQSFECVAGRSLAKHLVQNMRLRAQLNHDTTDLLVAGVEASLWLAEQFATDLRRIFPHLNVVATSTNKLLGFGDNHPNQVFFPVADEVLPRRIDSRSCVLLISQSGQTFSTLHATRRLAKALPAVDRLWILTGCFNSKMEQVLQQRHAELGTQYGHNRVLNNFSGHRPAEPSSVAVAATWHTLTRLVLQIVKTCRYSLPGGRIVHPWDYNTAALVIQAHVRGYMERKSTHGSGSKLPATAANALATAIAAAVASDDSSRDGDDENADYAAAATAEEEKEVESAEDSRSNTITNNDSSYDDLPSRSVQFVDDVTESSDSPMQLATAATTAVDSSAVDGKLSRQRLSRVSGAVQVHSAAAFNALMKKSVSNRSITSLLSDDSSTAATSTAKAGAASHRSKPQLHRPHGSRRSSSRGYSMKGHTHSKMSTVMNLSDGCITDLQALLSESFLNEIEDIVGFDVEGNPLDSSVVIADRSSGGISGSLTSHLFTAVCHLLRWVCEVLYRYCCYCFNCCCCCFNSCFEGVEGNTDAPASQQQHLSRLRRSTSLTSVASNPAATTTVATTATARRAVVHNALVQRGRAWAEHINEPWKVLVLAGIYLLLSVGLGLPLFTTVGNALLIAITATTTSSTSNGRFLFSLCFPSDTFGQHWAFWLSGLLLQIADALLFIYLAKHITRALRFANNRPLAARHGRRTIVIVDNPTVHQLLENFVSKLYSQSYSVVSVEVHGASGLDHFVHRFTHRVVRGILLAIGRPDGRLCCLAKSEASVLLSAKQASFIKNPAYAAAGSGPEIVTIGHNPFQPSLGLAHHIVLNERLLAAATAADHNNSSSSSNNNRRAALKTQHKGQLPLMSVHSSSGSSDDGVAVPAWKTRRAHRRKFVEEYLYDRLFLAQRPFTTSILRTLRQSLHHRCTLVDDNNSSNSSGAAATAANETNAISNAVGATTAAVDEDGDEEYNSSPEAYSDRLMPFGVHHIDPSVLQRSHCVESTVIADFLIANREVLTRKIIERGGIVQSKKKSYDPAVRLAFYSKLDQQTRQVQDLQVVVQQFYECRIASLQRYVAFCVMFHAMAVQSHWPWFKAPWDIARSQSNLRVATTASPIGALEAAAEESLVSIDKFYYARRVAACLRKFTTHF